MEKPPPLQGVARADLRKKFCSIGNELLCCNEEVLLGFSGMAVNYKKEKDVSKVNLIAEK